MAAQRNFTVARSAEPEWAQIVERLWQERELLVADFLQRFSAISYGGAHVPEQDVYDTAVDTMDMFIFEMAGAELPPDLRALPRDIAVRRARQGVPLDAFLEAVRNDFRVLWKGLERVARPDGIGILVSNMDRVLDMVEGYVSNIQQAFAEEEALLARDKQLYRQRLLTRLFHGQPGDEGDVSEIAATLGVQPAGSFEVLAVIDDAVPQAQRAFAAADGVYVYENAEALYVFRPQRKGRSWLGEGPGFPAGYVSDVPGLAAVPAAAASALVLARNRRNESLLATVEETWMGIADGLLSSALPGFADRVTEALDRCTPHERERLLQVARSYARTGSIKETSEELYCHRNTVVNRLRSLQDVIGLDLTVPAQAARALVALSRYSEPSA
ncbi:helix-turn-helix domain-containing protein [Sinomonas gamaensis]|uniref:helix-turn-helix domain-containing protein n=1 Tax=Sinomonas gamaensis TaxID=2565624 RepID=UPI00201650EF|nr:helix-turn-helix domain-containing protein [Sinomonas gamaensis]